jgi:hypothetical protein
MLGAPPPAWTVVDGDDWSAGGAGIAPHSGSAHFNPGTPGVLQAELEQLVDLSAFATYVDTGTTQLDFIGYGASLGDGNDDYRIELFVLDANGDSLVEFDTDWRTHTGWEPAEYGAMAPVGTRAVRVRLRCRYSGGARCDGYFDDLDLTATYSGD